MRRAALLSVLFLVSAPVAPTASADTQATFYVAPDGSDENPGTPEKPFQTLDRARQTVRKINGNMTGDIVVVLRGGTYAISKTVTFDGADSGSAGHDVIYRAAPKECPVISGGRRITGWQPDAANRWKAKTDLEDFRQLYVGGVRAVRARSGKLGPNPNPGTWEYLHDCSRGGGLGGAAALDNQGYRTTAVEMAGWRNPGDIEFCYGQAWTQSRCKVQSITRQGDHAVVTMLQPYFTHARTKAGVRVNLPDYIENALELLDEPGEWYLDRPAKTVYYLPRPGEDMSKVEVIAPAVETLVQLRGTLELPVQKIHGQPVRHIRFEGITFRHGGWLRPNKIGHVDVQANFVFDPERKDSYPQDGALRNPDDENLKSPANVICRMARSIRFERCTFTQLGGAGLDIEFGSQDNVVSGCRFHDISGTAIQVGAVERDDHHPDDLRKVVKNNTVVNCFIHDCCVEYPSGVGVFVGYTEATRIAHNEICRLPYSAVSVGWGWGQEDAGGGGYKQPLRHKTPTPAQNNCIERNHIHHVLQPRNDGGGVYTLGNQPGTIIRANHIHDNNQGPGGIYLDEGSGYIEVAENLVVNVPRAMNYNNSAQQRYLTCKVHDNFFSSVHSKDLDTFSGAIPPAAQPIAQQAGLEPAYRDLLEQKP